MKVLFIQTGGTIDKDYFEKVKSYAFEIHEPAVASIFSGIAVNFDYEIKSVLKKDSMDMTTQDRLFIKNACANATQDKIIITHGTDTMVDTAKVLHDVKGKTIVLTGAMYPEVMKRSDAAFNVGTAVGAINLLGEGVYIAMSGRIYPWDNVKKDLQTGKFVNIK